MKLTKVQITERTESHILFTIEIETKTLWGKIKTSQYKCTKKLDKYERYTLLTTGETINSTFNLFIDNALEAILSSKNDNWSAV